MSMRGVEGKVVRLLDVGMWFKDMSDLLSRQAERAIASVVEAECPLCKVEMRIHYERACCPCCGDGYKASQNRSRSGSARRTDVTASTRR